MTLPAGKAQEPNFFDEFGLEVTSGEVEIGKTYPIFGMITDIKDDSPDSVTIEINFNIKAKIVVGDTHKVSLLKQRAFESGIFVSTILTKDPSIMVHCRTIIFGRPQSHQA